MKSDLTIIILFILFILQSSHFAQNDTLHQALNYSLSDTLRGIEYFKTGKEYLGKAKYDSSIIAYQEAEKIYGELLKQNDNYNLWLKYIQAKNYIGYNLCYLSKYDNALDYLTEARNLCFEHLGEESLTTGQIYQSNGIYYDFTGDLSKSLEMFQKALEVRIKLLGENHSDVADTYNSIGIVYSKRSNIDKALEYFLKSLEIKKKIYGEEHSHTAASYNNIGINYYDRGDYGTALEYYHKALAIRLKVIGEQHHLTASSYNNIGNVYYNINEFDEANENHLKALSIRKNLLGEKHDLVATSYNNLGLVAWKKKELDKALIYFNLALDIRLEKFNQNHPSIAQSYMNIGLVYFDKNDFTEAMNCYEKALDIWANLGETKLSEISKIYQNIAELYFNENKYDSSLIATQKSLIASVFDFNDENIVVNPGLNSIVSEIQLLNSLKIKAKNYFAMSSLKGLTKEDQIKKLNNSLAVTELADTLIDKMITGFKSEESKFFLGDKVSSVYELAIETILQLYELTKDKRYKEKVFYFIEKSKAIVLRQGMLESKAKHFTNIPAELLEQEKSLKDDLLFYNTQLQSELQKKSNQDSLKLYDYQSKVFDLKNDYEKLIGDIEVNYPAYFNLKYKSELKTVFEIQKSIAGNSSVIDYFVGDRSIYILLISNVDFEIIRVNKPENFNELVKEFYTSILKSQTESYIKYANKISEIILYPVLNKLSNTENLVIIPHDILFKVPFEALFVKQSPVSNKNYSSLAYLIKKFNISYHYSVNLFADDRNENKINTDSESYKKNFIGFAPVFPKDNLFGYTITNKSNILLASNEEVIRSVSVDGKTFDELKYSEWEVNSIVDLFNSDNSTKVNTAYFYDNAKEDSFKVNAKDYKIVHIASHSFMNEDQPDISGVVFAQPTDSNFTNDGILYSAETYNLDLSADLVVLSCCESGLGKLFKSEGMIALTRGFLYSGTSNILFSLWKIPDKHTSELMVEFYRQMINGKSYSESLKKAKLKLIKNQVTARPRSWAGFLLIGSD
jgi:CHAT domain-containing protein/Tfp pilus assembly protein PilF